MRIWISNLNAITKHQSKLRYYITQHAFYQRKSNEYQGTRSQFQTWI